MGPLNPLDPFAPMAVPIFFGVDKALGFTFIGALALLLVAVWWAVAGDGVAIPRERWPRPVRLLALLGWGCWGGGLLGQVLAYVLHVGLTRW
jgi:hypothetical protein